MVLDFVYENPTRIYFGKSALANLAEELKHYGQNVMFVYGKNSIKRSGLYDLLTEILKTAGKNVIEHSGIKSNPTYEQMMQGAQLVRDHRIDLILAVGGGSVVDCAKAISVAAYAHGDAWQRYWIDYEALDNPVVPVGAVLTMAGTGSEMNAGSVITHDALKIKAGRVFGPQVNPRFSILNPEYTYTVPRLQMVSGIFDTLSHLMEQYFCGEDDSTTDYVIEGVMRSLINSARVALADPQNYEARSNIMWCATLGLNTITGVSKSQDWEVHMIEHQIGAYTDCPHGAGLAVVSPAYYRYIYKYGIEKFVRFAKTIWDVDVQAMSQDEAARAGIDRLEDFIRELGLPLTLRELGADESMLAPIADSTVLLGGYRKMTRDDVFNVLKACY